MRYRIAGLMLLFVLPVRYPFAAPAPERPYAILEIGQPPKGKTAEEHCKEQIHILTGLGGLLNNAWCDPEVRKLGLFDTARKSAKRKPIFPWLQETMRVTAEKDGRRLRFTFHAGNRAEQVVVINALLRQYIRSIVTEPARNYEKFIHDNEEAAPNVAKLIKEERDVNTRMQYQAQRAASLARGEEFRAELVRFKQVSVIKWAK